VPLPDGSRLEADDTRRHEFGQQQRFTLDFGRRAPLFALFHAVAQQGPFELKLPDAELIAAMLFTQAIELGLRRGIRSQIRHDLLQRGPAGPNDFCTDAGRVAHGVPDRPHEFRRREHQAESPQA
jgi:hypothetical protein